MSLSRRCAGCCRAIGDFTAVIVGAVVPEQQGFANELKEKDRGRGPAVAHHDHRRTCDRGGASAGISGLTIYAFTSRNEGFGLTLIEAMSAGAALVASRAGAAEFVVEDGVTGVLMPPGDVDALVAALEPLMRDPASAAAMGDAGTGARGGKIQPRCRSQRNREVYRTLV